MNASPRRRKKPFNPALADYQARIQAEEDAKKRDRKSRDLLRNARVAPAEIADPISGETIIVFRSTRDDPLADMLARKEITICEYDTGRHWQKSYEASEIGGVRGIDPTKEAVDGGKVWEGLTDHQRKAILAVSNARTILGENGNFVVTQILGHKVTLTELALKWKGAMPGSAGYRYVSRRFHECLETLGILFGYVGTTRA